MKYVEFLEFIGRIGYLKYKNETDTPLDEKIERILDEIFRPLKLKRIQDNQIIDEDASSEESCVIDS